MPTVKHLLQHAGDIRPEMVSLDQSLGPIQKSLQLEFKFNHARDRIHTVVLSFFPFVFVAKKVFLQFVKLKKGQHWHGPRPRKLYTMCKTEADD